MGSFPHGWIAVPGTPTPHTLLLAEARAGVTVGRGAGVRSGSDIMVVPRMKRVSGGCPAPQC